MARFGTMTSVLSRLIRPWLTRKERTIVIKKNSKMLELNSIITYIPIRCTGQLERYWVAPAGVSSKRTFRKATVCSVYWVLRSVIRLQCFLILIFKAAIRTKFLQCPITRWRLIMITWKISIWIVSASDVEFSIHKNIWYPKTMRHVKISPFWWLKIE